jgi:hypothetical protein
MSTTSHQLPDGRTIVFSIFQQNTDWNDVSGIYAFCSVNPNGTYRPFYIGQASSFKNRLPNHERWASASRLGATFILAVAIPLQTERDSIERQLIRQLQPPLNDHHK